MAIDISKLELKIHPDPSLKAQCHDIDPNDPDLPAVLDKMVAIMFAYNGKAIAAPQIGLDWNVFVVDLGPGQEPRALINPQIECHGATQVESKEGCLSLPGVAATIRTRYEEIEISTCLPKNTERVTLTLRGGDAIVFQHEYDHLQGLVLFDRMERVQKMMAKKKYFKKDPAKQLENQLEYIKVNHQFMKAMQKQVEAKKKELNNELQSEESECGHDSADHRDGGSSDLSAETATTASS